MPKAFILFVLIATGTWIVDQSIKSLFVDGYCWWSKCVSLELHYNKGVAFSLFAFLGPYLKWIQLTLIAGIGIYVISQGFFQKYALPLGLLAGAATSNLYDRFLHGGVVDYVAWHCWFDFAVFNYADVMIDIAIIWIVILSYFENSKQTPSA